MFQRQFISGFAVLLLSACVTPNALQRHVADSRFCAEQFTTDSADGSGVGVGGTAIYNKSFNLPSGQNTIFITFSGTGDGHGGAAHWFTASVNGTVCNRGNDGAGFAPAGWIPLQKHRDSGGGGDGGGGIGDLHDNGIYYTWCCLGGVRPGGSNAIEIKLASSIQGEFVFVERSHVYVDSVGAKLCMALPCDELGAAEALKSTVPPGHRHPQRPDPPKPPQ